MPLARQTINPLWHYPCSPSAILTQSRLRATTRPTRRAPSRYLASPEPQSPARSYHVRLQPNPPPVPQPVYLEGRPFAHEKPLSRDQELRDQANIRALDIRSAYQELRRFANQGNYSHLHLQTCVRILVKERGQKPNLRLYDALLLANTDHEYGSAAEVATILDDITNEGLTPESATYHAALKVLAVHPNYLLRCRILEELRQRWFSLTNDGWNHLVAGIIKDRQLEVALDLLDQMHKQGTNIHAWVYDLMLYTLCSAEEFDLAVDLMQRRISSGELYTSATLWYHLLDTASRSLHHRATLFAFRARVESSYLNPSTGMCTNILSTAARHGDTHLATSVLRILGRRSGNPIQLHHYEALLEAYMAANDLRTGLTLLTIMMTAGHTPTEASTRPVFIYLRQLPTLPATALAILQELREQNRQIPIQAINVVMEAYLYHRDLASALSLYKTLNTFGAPLKPTTATFNLFFRGCTQAARKDLAMFLVAEMVALKVAPDALTYDRLILVCLNSEDSIEDAWRYFEEMRGLGWLPRDGTAVALARRGCERMDRRVWSLVDDKMGRAIPKTKMQALIEEYWKGSAGEVEEQVKSMQLVGS